MSRLLGNRQLAGLLLSAAGMMLVHEWAYGISRVAGLAAPRVSHSHLAAFWSTIGPLAALSLAALAVRQSRHLHLSAPLRPGRLAAATGSMFLTMELIEFARAGLSAAEAFASPQVTIGLLLALPVAVAMSRLATVAREVARSLTAPARRRAIRLRPASTIAASAHVIPCRELLAFSVCRRGPPARLR